MLAEGLETELITTEVETEYANIDKPPMTHQIQLRVQCNSNIKQKPVSYRTKKNILSQIIKPIIEAYLRQIILS